MESMREVDRVMVREIKKGSTPIKFEKLGFGDYSYNKITSKEKLLRCFPICCGLESIINSLEKQ